ncbi:hypothetical protein [Micromonospora arida]
MASTPINGFPYQGLLDPPHGPNLGKDLAEAVEAALDARKPQGATVTLSSLYNLTTTLTDLPGCTITFSTSLGRARVLINFTADCLLVTANTTTLAVVNASVDGVDQPPQAVWGPGNMSAGAGTRQTTSNSLTVIVTGTGNHTIKLRGALSNSAGGAIRLQAANTSLSALILPY